MIAAAALVGYLALATALGPRALSGAWTLRSPAAALRCWQALCASVLLAGALVPLTLAVPYLPVDHVLAHVVHAEPLAVAGHYRGPLGVGPVLLAHGLATLALAALATSAVRHAVQTSRVRRRQRRSLGLVGEPHADGYVVVPSPTPAVWCLPGRRSTVAVTTGARALLTPAQLRATLLHERRHLRARHGTAVGTARVLARAFPGVALFAAAERATSVLVELAADDAARAPAERRALRQALVVLSGAGPVGTLAASGTATLLRVQLLAEAGRPSRTRHTLALGLGAVVLVVPLLVALAPALEAAVHHCLPDVTRASR